MSKFHILCSCTICKTPLTVQSLVSHYNKHQKDSVVKSFCPTCDSPIFTKNKFCNQSCAAKFNNTGKRCSIKSKSKVSHTIQTKILNGQHTFTKPPFTPINFCIQCRTLIRGKRKTCSDRCKNIHHSSHMANLIYNGHNPNKNRGRGKQSYMEKSFEAWINSFEEQIEYITEYPIKRLDMIKTYFADFYFPALNLIIELDGSQHNTPKQRLYDVERDLYISQTYDLTIIRISHNDYVKKTKISEIRAILGI